MIVAFIIWSIISICFFCIGIYSKMSRKAIHFYTFEDAPVVKNIKAYNNAVSKLWIAFAILLELMGLPFLVLKQNSLFFIFLMFPIFFGIITMMILYNKIVDKYTK